MSNMNKVFKSCSKVSSLYVICLMARQSKILFPSSFIRTMIAFDLVHVDNWCPCKSTTHDGNMYFLKIVDDLVELFGLIYLALNQMSSLSFNILFLW